MHTASITDPKSTQEKIMLKYLLALSILMMGATYAAADTTVTIKINKKAPYTVTLLQGGKSVGSGTGKGSQNVRIKADTADKYCIKFSGGYVMKAPDGRVFVQSCRPIVRTVRNIWGHNNIVKQ